MVGSLAPVVFYVHSQQFGYAYQSILSLAFFAIFATGLVHFEITRLGKFWLHTLWLTVHIGLSVVLLPFGYHIYISYAHR
ncbi:MAG: hypothetical protein ACPW60_14465 [Methylohalobius sp. ZOD2]